MTIPILVIKQALGGQKVRICSWRAAVLLGRLKNGVTCGVLGKKGGHLAVANNVAGATGRDQLEWYIDQMLNVERPVRDGLFADVALVDLGVVRPLAVVG